VKLDQPDSYSLKQIVCFRNEDKVNILNIKSEALKDYKGSNLIYQGKHDTFIQGIEMNFSTGTYEYVLETKPLY
jgi:hypothetical protein